MGVTRITMVRHGETEWNVTMRLQGMKNSDLTKKGIRQARQAANALRKRDFDRLISSDQERAVKTAQQLNEYHHLEIETDPALRERNFGIMEGLTREEIMERYPETYHGYMDRKDSYRIPEGETLIDFYARVTGGINRIVQMSEGQNLLIVTHGGVLDCMMRMLFDIPLTTARNFSIYNGSINEFSYEQGKWHLDTWGKLPFH